MSRRARRALGRLLLVAGSTAATLVFLELALALTGSATPDPPLYPGERTPPPSSAADPLIGWKLPPRSTLPHETEEFSVAYRANRQGFRSPRDFDKPTGRRRIAFLGDSFTMGTGVDYRETFPALLERKLKKSRADNFGMVWFGIDQMWMTLRHHVLPRHPDLVILSFIRADLERSLSAYQMGEIPLAKPVFRLDGGRLVPRTAADSPPALWRFAERHSRLLEVWRKGEASLDRYFARGRAWRLNRAIFEQIRDDCEAASVPLVVVYLPTNRRSPAPALAREFAALGIDFLDLTTRLPAASDDLYYRDGHFNPAGHRFAAEAIHAFLKEKGLVRPRPLPR